MKSLVAEKKPVRGETPRALALRILLQVIDQGKSLSPLLENGLPSLPQERDKRFCAELCYGVCRYYFVLDASLQKLLSKGLKSRDRDIRIVILLGLYQIRFLRVEDHAAVNEAVKMLSIIRKPWARGLVNGVLRNYLRSADSLARDGENPLSTAEQSLAYPNWIKRQVRQDWGDQADQVLTAGNQHAPLVLRLNTRLKDRQQYLEQLSQHGISARAHPVVETAVVLNRAMPVEQLPGFANGLTSVQDAAAQLAAPLLDCRPGMSVLDACAAPGGKTLHILQHASDLDMLALDKDAERLQKVRQNLDRAGLSAQLADADASRPDDWCEGRQFDRILLDAPCSASGIIRRHPDIRLLRQPGDIEKLVSRQARLLDALWRVLKPGGRLLYSTCSILREENENQVARFLSRQPGCVELPINTVQWGQNRNPGRQILPGFQEMDGFYYACLEKAANC